MFNIKFIFTGLLLVALVTLKAQSQAPSFTFTKGVTIAHWTDFLFTGRTYGDPKWFAEKDVQWIANHGLDHLLIRVSGKEISNDQGLDFQRILVLDSAISWAAKAKLGVILHLQEYPQFVKDSTLTKAQQEEQQLSTQVEFWNGFAKYFSKYKEGVRFNIELQAPRLPKTIANINRYNTAIVKEIRKHSSDRKIYLATVVADSISILAIPNDENVILNVVYDGIPLFTGQAWIHASHPDFPRIKFPGKVPDLSPYSLPVNLDWAKTKKYSNTELSATNVEESLKKYYLWRKKYYPSLELYVPFWGYATGWPYKPANAVDVKSISNYGMAFTKACKKYNINWAVYDYNSGMSINVNDNEPSVLLKALKLKTK